MKKRRKHPMQPILWDGHGVIRFQANPIVRFLLDKGPFTLNRLAERRADEGWSREDWSHLCQLIGYSVSGWGGLDCASDSDRKLADTKCDELLKRIEMTDRLERLNRRIDLLKRIAQDMSVEDREILEETIHDADHEAARIIRDRCEAELAPIRAASEAAAAEARRRLGR